jgi:Fe-S cluster assembly protein SufD
MSDPAVRSAEPYLARFAALENDLSTQPEWLAGQRRDALEAFRVEGFPNPRAEEWRYTNVRPIVRQQFAPSRGGEVALDGHVVPEARIGSLDLIDLVFVNGRFRPELSDASAGIRGINVTSLATAIAEQPDGLQGLLGGVVRYDDNPFAALNGAFFEDGALIDVAADMEPDRPIRLLLFSTSEHEPVECHPRVLIRLGRHARASVIEHYLGTEGARNFCNVVSEVRLEDGSRLEHYRLQQESAQGFLVASLHATVMRDANLISHNVNLGGRLVRQDLNVRLEQPGAAVELYGLMLAGGRQHVDNHTRVHHVGERTRSQQSYKCVLDDNARGVFKGRVMVDRNAQKIEAHQSSGNLLLSDGAEIDTKPELEIYADDVVCSHGATIGQLDESSLFYLRSRGIDEQTARALLIFAFADEVISKMDLGAVRARLEELIVGRLPDSETLRGFV